jgi:hypothetical protein
MRLHKKEFVYRKVVERLRPLSWKTLLSLARTAVKAITAVCHQGKERSSNG